MKWAKESLMKDGTKIRIEDWSEDYCFLNPFDRVVAYPICKKTISPYIKEEETFRLELSFSSKKESENAFESLITGKKVFSDYLKNIDKKYHECI